MAIDTSRLKKAAVALGASTYGTAALAFTRGLLVSDFSCNPDQSVEGVPEVRGTLETIRVTKGPIGYKPKLTFPLDAGDADSAGIGDFLASLLGTEVGTNVSGGFFTHKFTLNNTAEPSWLNLYSDKDSVPKQVTGFRPGALKLGINAKEAVIPVEVEGIAQDEADLAAAQTIVFCDEAIMTPHIASVLKLGGANVTTEESIELSIIREQEGMNFVGNSRVIGALASGKQFRIELVLNGLKFADETERAKFKAVGTSSFELKLLDAAGNYLHFVFPQINYQTFEGPDVKDTDIMRRSLAGIVTGLSTGGTPFFVELKNKYASRYDTGAAIV